MPSLVGAMIPAFAVLLWPARASGGRHLVLATHTVSALIAVSLVLMISLSLAFNIARFLGADPAATDSIDPVLLPASGVLFALYVRVSARRVYWVPRWRAAISGAFLGTIGFAFAFGCFRLFLFVVTFWTLNVPA